MIEAPVEVVWRTITEPDQIARWFADRVELDLRPGGQGTFDFRSRATTRPATVPLQVEVVDPPHRFAFRWVLPEGGAPGPGNSVLVDFTLTAERVGGQVPRVEQWLAAYRQDASWPAPWGPDLGSPPRANIKPPRGPFGAAPVGSHR